MWLRGQRLDVTVYGFPSGMLVAIRTGGFEERFVRIGFGSNRTPARIESFSTPLKTMRLLGPKEFLHRSPI
jgi:hypothetical protein